MSDSIPGWYPDPTVTGQQRYWDGTQWTENVAPLPPSAPPPPPPPGYAPTPPPYAGYGATGYAVPAYAAPQPGATYAHWGLRLAGYLIDSLIVAPFSIGAAVVLGANTTTTGYDAYGNAVTSTSTSGAAIAGLLYLAGFVILAWNLFYRQGRTGYSVGKQVLGIKLIKEATGQPLGAWPAFGRQLLHILDALSLGIGYLWPLWDRKRQTFADKIMASVVIVAPKPKS